jgi:hypothetical protein
LLIIPGIVLIIQSILLYFGKRLKFMLLVFSILLPFVFVGTRFILGFILNTAYVIILEEFLLLWLLLIRSIQLLLNRF